MAHTTYTIAHDDAHGGVEDQLATLLAALAGSLAALVLHAFGDGGGDAGGALVRHCGCHRGYLMVQVICSLYRPYRRQASSHRGPTIFRTCAVPVGAGLPAIGPVLTT
ncbi:hypothetical protein D3C78_1512570 [compost metagenome]